MEHWKKEVIGWCSYHTWYLAHDLAEIGYDLYQADKKQKGLISEAIHPIVNFGFNQLILR